MFVGTSIRASLHTSAPDMICKEGESLNCRFHKSNTWSLFMYAQPPFSWQASMCGGLLAWHIQKKDMSRLLRLRKSNAADVVQ